MKKIIPVLVLVLVIAAVAVVCVSCAKKEEEVFEDGKVSYTVVNNTGKNVILLSLADTRSDNKMEAKPLENGLPDGESVGLELNAKLEKNAPSVMFTFTVEGGDYLSAQIQRKNGTITMLSKDGKLDYTISEPGK
jgi:hypothetical protein